MGAGPAGVHPRERVNAVRRRVRHELVVGRVERDLVKAVAVPVEEPELGPVDVRGDAEGHELGAREAAEGGDVVLRPSAALAMQGVAKRRIGRVQVDVLERRRLVHDVVGDAKGGSIAFGHGDASVARGRADLRVRAGARPSG